VIRGATRSGSVVILELVRLVCEVFFILVVALFIPFVFESQADLHAMPESH